MKTAPLLSIVVLLLSACSQSPETTLYTHTARDAALPMTFARLAPRDAGARQAACALIDSMTDGQRSNTVLPLNHEARGDWHFVPRRRRGLALGDMNDAQRHELHRLLQAGLSDSGYLKAMDIVWLESVLRELEGRTDGYRDPGRYNLLLFGDPADADAAWGWRFEGHHLSLNFTYDGGGEHAVTTPMFMGTAPAVVPSGLHAGKRILADEHNLAFDFIAMLTDEQRAAMMIGDVPGDVVTGPGREDSLREPAGLACSGLDEAQSAALMDLVMVYAYRLDRAHKEKLTFPAILERDSIHFAWAGSTDPESPHYYRIYLPDTLVIEYCTRDGGVDHIHGVMHDLTDPHALDLLAEHFREEHGAE